MKRPRRAIYRGRVERGKCTRCQWPVVDGKTMCARHLEINRDRVTNYREARHG